LAGTDYNNATKLVAAARLFNSICGNSHSILATNGCKIADHLFTPVFSTGVS